MDRSLPSSQDESSDPSTDGSRCINTLEFSDTCKGDSKYLPESGSFNLHLRALSKITIQLKQVRPQQR
jgi:hypothetical protein